MCFYIWKTTTHDMNTHIADSRKAIVTILMIHEPMPLGKISSNYSIFIVNHNKFLVNYILSSIIVQLFAILVTHSKVMYTAKVNKQLFYYRTQVRRKRFAYIAKVND